MRFPGCCASRRLREFPDDLSENGARRAEADLLGDMHEIASPRGRDWLAIEPTQAEPALAVMPRCSQCCVGALVVDRLWSNQLGQVVQRQDEPTHDA